MNTGLISLPGFPMNNERWSGWRLNFLANINVKKFPEYCLEMGPICELSIAGGILKERESYLQIRK